MARHAVRGAAWGLGVALGVALGAYLTAVGGTGAPGATSLDVSEILQLPLLAGATVFIGVTLLSAVASYVAGVLNARRPHKNDHDDEHHEHDGVAR